MQTPSPERRPRDSSALLPPQHEHDRGAGYDQAEPRRDRRGQIEHEAHEREGDDGAIPDGKEPADREARSTALALLVAVGHAATLSAEVPRVPYFSLMAPSWARPPR